MDRRVKERLVGATILLMLVVLIVPELLSGPKRAAIAPGDASPGDASPGVVLRGAAARRAAASGAVAPPATNAAPGYTVTVQINRQAATIEPTQGEGTAAASAAGTPAAASSGETRSPAPVPPAASTLRGETPPGSALPSSDNAGAWAVQLGSFAAKANADKLVHDLNAQGYAVYVSSSGAGTAVRYRVRMGPLADRDAAERSIAQLKTHRFAASIVPPAP